VGDIHTWSSVCFMRPLLNPQFCIPEYLSSLGRFPALFIVILMVYFYLADT
jgi:hypothetical protein